MQSGNKAMRLMLGASLLALTVGALSSGVAQAQTATDTAVVEDSSVSELIVVGARAAERSAIDRKKRSATVSDSIVADDVGQFPDKSAAEAIARISGVALDVSDSGEAGGFTIRGQSADLIRIEVDGMTTLDNTGGQGGRNAQLNELSSDLIKSVDVIKGQTADMTPGGVGGTVRIEQRNGLDFAKPLYKLNLQFQNSSLNDEWTPRINAIFARRFLDGRLGILLNATYDQAETTQDFARISDKNAGYIPFGDQDNSAEKTFVTPYDPIAAAVTTKAGCAQLSTAGINSRLNCYAQWEDYTPSLVRYGRGYRVDTKFSAQVRLDFRVNDHLTVFASYNPNLRDFESKDFNLSIATPTGTTSATAGPFTRTGAVPADPSGALVTNFRALNVNENHYVTQYAFVRTGAVGAPGTGATVASLNYSTQVRDILRTQEQTYYQTGADFDFGKWTGKARAQYGTALNEREDWAWQINAPLDYATFSLIPGSGVWTVDAVAQNGIDLTSPAAFYAQPNATTGISPNSQFEYTPQADKSNELALQLDMIREFDGDAGIFTRFKWGIQSREFQNETFREGGAFNLGSGVIQGRARALDQIRACQAPAFTVVAPATTPPCTLGSIATPGRGVSDLNYKTHSLTTAQYNSIIDAIIMPLPGGKFFADLSDGEGLLDTWTVFNMDKFRDEFGQYADISDWNMSCLYNCIASDGKTYKHRSYTTSEKTQSAYGMFDFESEVLGMGVFGNIGVRVQQIDVEAQTVLAVQNRVAVPTVTSGRPTYGFTDTVVTAKETTIEKSSRDVLPSFNLAVWPIEDKVAVRYSIAKQRARPSLTALTGTSVVTCNNVDEGQRAALEAFLAANPGALDDGNVDTDDSNEATGFINSYIDRCSGRVGNPSLKGYAAVTQNLSAEWYPNRDTQISVAAYEINVESGRPANTSDDAYVIDGNSYFVDTYEDGEGGLKTRGIEVAAKTAFTFLPSILRHTGGGFNMSTAKSSQSSAEFDILTQQFMPPKQESSYYYNLNLWYDDGRVNARVAYQARDVYFQDLAFESANRVGPPDGSTASYFKVGSPAFRSKTNSLDARASYKLSEKIQFFIEGKNLLDDTQYRFTPEQYRQIQEGTTYRWDNTFVGRKYYAGLILTF